MTQTRREPQAQIPADVIPIRPDEDFDHGKLADYLRGKLPGSDRPLEVEQFGGGHANLTYLLRFGDQEYVLRRPPLGPVAAKSHDMGREFRVLSVLHRAYPLAPKALLQCDDADVMGASFFVMERRRGVVVRRAIPPQFGGGEDRVVNRKISEALVDALAELHEVSYEDIGLGDLGKPDGFLRRQVDGWMGRYERAKTKPQPMVDDLVAWLRERLPVSPAPTLLHNDWRLDNMMLDGEDPGRVEAVFDWDMCTLGDPLADVGTVLASWIESGESEGGSGVGTMPSYVPGFLTRREAVDRYCTRRGVDPGLVPYYFVFGLFKMGVVLQQIYVRYHRGQTKDERFAPLEQIAEMLFLQAKSRSEQANF